MNGTDFKNTLDEDLDGHLADAEKAEAGQHLSGCGDCQEIVKTEQLFRKALKSLPVPNVSDGFFDRAINNAVSSAQRKQRMRWISTGFGGAIAAGIAAWVVFGVLLTTPDLDNKSIAGLTITLHETEVVRLAFDSAVELQNATLMVQLPAGVEIAGYENESLLKWSTTILQGRNVLELPVVAHSGGGGILVATVVHDDKRREFQIQIDVS